MSDEKKLSGSRETSPGVFLSVVIPAFNEARRIPSSLEQIVPYLESLRESYEVVVVDDGSTDGTGELVEHISEAAPSVRLLRSSSNAGKGASVRKGMLDARGKYLLFTDADLSAPIKEAERLLEPLQGGYDVVIGSRALRREWIGVHQSYFRETAGRMYNFALRGLTRLEFGDTQCGFMAFRREAARSIFTCQKIVGFGFDVETLYLARKFGCSILEVPVHWNNNSASKVRPLRDGSRMLLDLLRIRWNDSRGTYSRPAS